VHRTGTHRPARNTTRAPEIPDDVTGAELDKDARRELTSLSKDAARQVSRHLVMAGRLLDDEPELAWEHALAARGRAARIGIVREAAGLAAYRTGRFAEALAELRTARRLSGSADHLPLMADAERGLGRPERALAIAVSPDAAALDTEGRIEMLIVAAGARTDLGQLDAAVVTLDVPQLHGKGRSAWLARLRSAYADALAAVGREDEARHWLEAAAEADEDGSTGAADRLEQLDGIELHDLDGDLDGDLTGDLDGDPEGDPQGVRDSSADGSVEPGAVPEPDGTQAQVPAEPLEPDHAASAPVDDVDAHTGGLVAADADPESSAPADGDAPPAGEAPPLETPAPAGEAAAPPRVAQIRFESGVPDAAPGGSSS
jgi:hypothetical protein